MEEKCNRPINEEPDDNNDASLSEEMSQNDNPCVSDVNKDEDTDTQTDIDDDDVYDDHSSDRNEDDNKIRPLYYDYIKCHDDEKISFRLARTLLDYVEIFAISVVVVLTVFTFFFRLCVVDGPSMEKTLYNGETIIITDLFYEPDYGDIVVFHQTSKKIDRFNEPIVKRVIAKEGDTIDIDFDTWTLYVNDKPVVESYRYLSGGYTLRSDLEFPLTVDEGHIFVMGDNRNNSSDSRNADIGLVDERRILGKLVVRLTPFDKFGSVD